MYKQADSALVYINPIFIYHLSFFIKRKKKEPALFTKLVGSGQFFNVLILLSVLNVAPVKETHRHWRRSGVCNANAEVFSVRHPCYESKKKRLVWFWHWLQLKVVASLTVHK